MPFIMLAGGGDVVYPRAVDAERETRHRRHDAGEGVCSEDEVYGRGCTSFVNTGFEPLVRMTLYLTDGHTVDDLFGEA